MNVYVRAGALNCTSVSCAILTPTCRLVSRPDIFRAAIYLETVLLPSSPGINMTPISQTTIDIGTPSINDLTSFVPRN